MADAPQSGLVVEDLPEARAWLVDALEHAFPGIVVREAADLASGRRACAEAIPAIALVDLGLPDGSGT